VTLDAIMADGNVGVIEPTSITALPDLS